MRFLDPIFRRFYGMLCVAFALALLMQLASAQVPSSNPPYNQDQGTQIGGAPTVSGLPQFNDTAQAPGTYNTGIQNNLDKVGAECGFFTTAESGSPSVQLNVQAYDAASKTFTTIASTNAANGTQDYLFNSVELGSGMTNTNVPTGMTIVGVRLPRYWRLQEVLAVAGTTRTGTSSCKLYR